MYPARTKIQISVIFKEWHATRNQRFCAVLSSNSVEMSDHHKYIQQAASSISQKYVNGSRSTPDHAKINLIKIDNSLNKGRELAFRRVYVREKDSGVMSKVGWIVPCDINYCMICATSFGFTSSKYNCAACGNVLCSNCVTSSSNISDIALPKPVTVCCQCCWGQV